MHFKRWAITLDKSVDLPFAALQPVSKLDDVMDYDDLATWTIATAACSLCMPLGSCASGIHRTPLSEIV